MLSTEANMEGTPVRRYRPCRTMEEIVLAFSNSDGDDPAAQLMAGKRELARLTGVSHRAVANWISIYNKAPPKYYLRIQNALKRNGYIGDPTLLGME
jgi:hypothetical protein